MGKLFGGALGVALVIAVIGFGLFQLVAGFAGIEHEFGRGWAWAALIAFFFRFSLPMVYGTFVAMTDLWHLHWFWALLIAAPGLALMIPGIVAAVIGAVRSKGA